MTASPCKDGTLAHEWKILPANGRYSPGVCKKCGTERIFRNSLTKHPWLESAINPMPNTVFPHKREGKG